MIVNEIDLFNLDDFEDVVMYLIMILKINNRINVEFIVFVLVLFWMN